MPGTRLCGKHPHVHLKLSSTDCLTPHKESDDGRSEISVFLMIQSGKIYQHFSQVVICALKKILFLQSLLVFFNTSNNERMPICFNLNYIRDWTQTKNETGGPKVISVEEC